MFTVDLLNMVPFSYSMINTAVFVELKQDSTRGVYNFQIEIESINVNRYDVQVLVMLEIDSVAAIQINHDISIPRKYILLTKVQTKCTEKKNSVFGISTGQVIN